MHREGHIGIGMAIYAPMTYYLTSVGLLQTFALGLAAISAWSFLPDIDMVLPVRHRGPTHSFVAAAVAGVINAGVFVYLYSVGYLSLSAIGLTVWYTAYPSIVVFGFALGFAGVVGHLFGDGLTPMGIEPWWPANRRNYSLTLVLAADEQANRTLGMAGAVAVTAALVAGHLGY